MEQLKTEASEKMHLEKEAAKERKKKK